MREITKLRKRRFPINEETTDAAHGKMNPVHAYALPDATSYPKADNYYDWYRMTISAAGLPDAKEPTSSAMADSPFSIGYSDWDQKIIDSAAKLCGFAGRKLGTKKSEEPEHIHKISPVHNWRAKKTT